MANEFDNTPPMGGGRPNVATTPQPTSARAWYYGPKGQARIFEDGVCPEGWYDHPRKVPDFREDGDYDAEDAPPSDIAALRAAYLAKFGKKPFMGWDGAELREKLGQ